MNKEAFLSTYRSELIDRYAWAADTAKLDRFMGSVKATISDASVSTWNHDGEAVTAAWRAIGGKGKPTKKALRALA
ncbi:hypothetical protein ABDF71_21610 [Ochrobactrum sp. WV_118_8]